MSAGLAEGYYAATVDVLANMAANLERD